MSKTISTAKATATAAAIKSIPTESILGESSAAATLAGCAPGANGCDTARGVNVDFGATALGSSNAALGTCGAIVAWGVVGAGAAAEGALTGMSALGAEGAPMGVG